MRGAIPLLSQYIFMVSYLVKHRDNFTFTFMPSSCYLCVCVCVCMSLLILNQQTDLYGTWFERHVIGELLISYY